MPDRILSVSQINLFIKRLIEGSAVLKRVVVEGEISNFRPAASGHLYFTLTDDFSQISCVMWRSDAQRLKFVPEDGMQVRLTGSIRVYEKGGTYQISVSKIEKAGVGNIFLEMEKIRKELEKRGWFNPELKTPLPKKIEKVGVVTSATGAAIHDILTTLRRRNPTLEVVLAPASVQGENAPEEIEEAVEDLNRYAPDLDVIIVGRGGGAIEDLQAFNTMPVLEAIHESKIPVVSAVGHERDVLLSDFVADLRAPTPTAAAELISEDFSELPLELSALEQEMERTLIERIRNEQMRLDLLTEKIAGSSPERTIEMRKQRLAALAADLTREMNGALQEQRLRLERSANLYPLIEKRLNYFKALYEKINERLKLLNPVLKLEQGYVYVSGMDGQAVTSAEQARSQAEMTLHFRDGLVPVVPEKEQDGEKDDQ